MTETGVSWRRLGVEALVIVGSILFARVAENPELASLRRRADVAEFDQLLPDRTC